MAGWVAFGNASHAYCQVDTGLFMPAAGLSGDSSIGSTRRMRPAWFGEAAPEVLASLAAGRVKIPIAARFP